MTTSSELSPEEVRALDHEKGPCAVCEGFFSEHQRPDIRHVFTTDPGELISKQEKAKQQRQPIRTLMMPPTGNDGVTNRLVEVLMDKGGITREEGLYIAGFGPKPSGFRDPAGG